MFLRMASCGFDLLLLLRFVRLNLMLLEIFQPMGLIYEVLMSSFLGLSCTVKKKNGMVTSFFYP